MSYFQLCVDDRIAFVTLTFRAGSVIVSAEAVVPTDNVRSSAGSLAVALLDMNGLNATVAGQTGSVGVTVGGVTGESVGCSCTDLTR